MNIVHATQSEQSQERFGRQVAARLGAGTAELSHDIVERLRAARVQAVARRKPALVRTVAAASGGAT